LLPNEAVVRNLASSPKSWSRAPPSQRCIADRLIHRQLRKSCWPGKQERKDLEEEMTEEPATSILRGFEVTDCIRKQQCALKT
jgi:hypothetical protein